MKNGRGTIWLGLALLLGFALAATAVAQAPPTTSGGSGMALLNLDNTVALHGYDPVAYFSRNRAVRGNRRILERLGGATYFFASLAAGRLEDINPHLFVIYEGKLYLFNNPDAEALFMRDPRRTIHEAREHYFTIASKQRSTY